MSASFSWDEPEGLAARGTLIVLAGRGEHGGVYERFGRRLAFDAYRVRAPVAAAAALAEGVAQRRPRSARAARPDAGGQGPRRGRHRGPRGRLAQDALRRPGAARLPYAKAIEARNGADASVAKTLASAAYSKVLPITDDVNTTVQGVADLMNGIGVLDPNVDVAKSADTSLLN